MNTIDHFAPSATLVPGRPPGTLRDSRRFRRIAGAGLLVVPATCLAVSRVVSPGLLADDSAGVLHEVRRRRAGPWRRWG